LDDFLFFSSRRRHTRCYRDWSSDVCSSDLLLPLDAPTSCENRNGATATVPKKNAPPHVIRKRTRFMYSEVGRPGRIPGMNPPCRSEERRVGKECRSEWAESN